MTTKILDRSAGLPRIDVNVICKKEDGVWVGHCLEMDIVTTGDSPEEVQSNIRDLVFAQVESAFENDNLENLFFPAPKEVWAEFMRCRKAAEEREGAVPDDLNGLIRKTVVAHTCISEEGLCGV